MIKRTALGVVFALALAAPALAQHGNYGAMPAATATQASTRAFLDANAKMHKDMGIAYSENADVDFVRGMIPHHQGAIDMAKVVQQHGKDASVTKLAASIISDQEKEIAWMQQWLRRPGNALTAMVEDHDHGTGHPAPMGDAAKALVAANDKMHRDMDIEFTGDADVDFVRGMIPHHQGAIDMAKVVLQHGKDAEVKKLADEIIAAQEKEIVWMRDWLKKQGK